MILSFISLKIMFDLSALKRLGLIRYIVLKLNHNSPVVVTIFKNDISTEKDVKYTFLQTIFLGHLSNQRQLFCVYTSVRIPVCVVFSSLSASFKLVIT